MATYHRRLRMLQRAANDEPRTGQQNWSDLHQQAQDQFEVARGILNAAILMGLVWAVVVACVFAVVAMLG
jgi:heme/copper-type cytochrome/quinol oxidase subunit 2